MNAVYIYGDDPNEDVPMYKKRFRRCRREKLINSHDETSLVELASSINLSDAEINHILKSRNEAALAALARNSFLAPEIYVRLAGIQSPSVDESLIKNDPLPKAAVAGMMKVGSSNLISKLSSR